MSDEAPCVREALIPSQICNFHRPPSYSRVGIQLFRESLLAWKIETSELGNWEGRCPLQGQSVSERGPMGPRQNRRPLSKPRYSPDWSGTQVSFKHYPFPVRCPGPAGKCPFERTLSNCGGPSARRCRGDGLRSCRAAAVGVRRREGLAAVGQEPVSGRGPLQSCRLDSCSVWDTPWGLSSCVGCPVLCSPTPPGARVLSYAFREARG